MRVLDVVKRVYWGIAAAVCPATIILALGLCMGNGELDPMAFPIFAAFLLLWGVFPYFVAYLVGGISVGHLITRRRRRVGETVWDSVMLALSVLLCGSALFCHFTDNQILNKLGLNIVLLCPVALGLLIVGVIGLLLLRRDILADVATASHRSPVFWGTAAVVLTGATVGALVIGL